MAAADRTLFALFSVTDNAKFARHNLRTEMFCSANALVFESRNRKFETGDLQIEETQAQKDGILAPRADARSSQITCERQFNSGGWTWDGMKTVEQLLGGGNLVVR